MFLSSFSVSRVTVVYTQSDQTSQCEYEVIHIKLRKIGIAFEVKVQDPSQTGMYARLSGPFVYFFKGSCLKFAFATESVEAVEEHL